MDHANFVINLLDSFPTDSKLTPEMRLFIIAQAAFESNWGSAQACQVNNVLNVTAGSREHGRAGSWPEPRPVYTSPTPNDWEPGSNGAKLPIHQYWRAYSTLEEAVADYLALLNWPRYQPARDALLGGNGELFIEYLGPDRAHQTPPIGGYYGLPTVKYLAGWQTCLSEVRAIVDRG